MNKNIAILSTTYLPIQGGIQYLLYWLLKELDNNYFEYKEKYKFDNIYFIIPYYKDSLFDKFNNISILYIDENLNKKGLFQNALKIRKYIIENDISLIHAHNALIDGILCYLSTLFLNCNYIITSHGIDFAYDRDLNFGVRVSFIKEKVIKMISNHAIKLTTVSSDMINFIAELVDKNKIVMIENCYDSYKVVYDEIEILNEVENIKDKYNIESTDTVYLTLSGARKIKGHDRMIEAFYNIYKNLGNTKIFIAAHGEETNTLKKLVKTLHLENNIYFIGFITDIQKEAFFRISDVYINTAIFEPFGLVYLEAIERNLAILGSIYGGGKDIFIHKKNAFLCDARDRQTIVDGFVYYDNILNRKNMIENSKRILFEYTATKVISKYLKLYMDCLNEGY